ncbi:MAG TPA: hypothetical protein VD865_03335 [Stenotrophomonas sp.]|nr:hypothetical protein [Stenotrophomonas sp.]
MWLRRLLGLPPSRKEALAGAFDPIDFNVNAHGLQAFREFTPPPQRQRGGSLRLAARRLDRFGGIRIVPLSGVKVP